MQFTTKDNDNDVAAGNCAQDTKGAWWYRAYHHSNLNGLYLRGPHDAYAVGVNWGDPFRGHHYSLKSTEMKVKSKTWEEHILAVRLSVTWRLLRTQSNETKSDYEITKQRLHQLVCAIGDVMSDHTSIHARYVPITWPIAHTTYEDVVLTSKYFLQISFHCSASVEFLVDMW